MNTTMTVAMLVPEFPMLTETFILRQARCLGATVYRLKRNADLPVPVGVEMVQLPQATRHARVLERTIGLGHLLLRGSRYYMGQPLKKAWEDELAVMRPDVVLAHYGETGLLALQSSKRLAIPLVVHFHGVDASRRLRNRCYRYSIRNLLQHAAGVVVVSDVQRRRLLDMGCAQSKVVKIMHGVPLDEFLPSQRVNERNCRFLAVGRMVEKKAPQLTIRAFARCREQCDNVTLTMVGGGPLEHAARNLARELGVSDIVSFLGPQPNSRVRELMGQSSVFVQHPVTASNGDEEGWPVAIGEACASGLSVVATRHAGIPDEVVHGKTGFLVEEGDWEGMSAYMRRLAQSPSLRKALGHRAREHIAREGNLTTQIEKLRTFIQQVSLRQ